MQHVYKYIYIHSYMHSSTCRKRKDKRALRASNYSEPRVETWRRFAWEQQPARLLPSQWSTQTQQARECSTLIVFYLGVFYYKSGVDARGKEKKKKVWQQFQPIWPPPPIHTPPQTTSPSTFFSGREFHVESFSFLLFRQQPTQTRNDICSRSSSPGGSQTGNHDGQTSYKFFQSSPSTKGKIFTFSFFFPRLPFRLGWFDSTSHIASSFSTPSSTYRLNSHFLSSSKIERKHEPSGPPKSRNSRTADVAHPRLVRLRL